MDITCSIMLSPKNIFWFGRYIIGVLGKMPLFLSRVLELYCTFIRPCHDKNQCVPTYPTWTAHTGLWCLLYGCMWPSTSLALTYYHWNRGSAVLMWILQMPALCPPFCLPQIPISTHFELPWWHTRYISPHDSLLTYNRGSKGFIFIMSQFIWPKMNS